MHTALHILPCGCSASKGMVIDNLKNAKFYYTLGKHIKKGLKYLQTTDFSKIENGKYEIDGENIFAVVNTYDTKPQDACQWEAHKKYIDIQYVAEGSEKIGYVNIKGLKIISDYNADNDIMFLKGSGNILTFESGMFILFTPTDAHMPGLKAGEAQIVKKVVVKVKI